MNKLPVSDRLRAILESRVGNKDDLSRQDEFERITNECPPIDPHLIKHLTKVFANGGIKPQHPQLGQLLQVQYGCDLIIRYLKAHYDKQSLAARRQAGV
jgi:hypothetical protein